ncbi:MAG: hypothetical protein ACOYOU_16565 [Kiritimatiellia bacterium]
MRKFCKVILCVLFLALLVLLLGVSGVLWFGRHDIPPPDISDLLLSREVIPDSENAYPFFVRATNALYWPLCVSPGTTVISLDTHVDAIFAGRTNDDAFVSAILASNRVALAELDRGLARPHFEPPEAKRYEDRGHALESAMVTIVRLVNLSALQNQKARRFDDSVQDITRLARLSKLTLENHSSGYVFASYLRCALSFLCGRSRALALEPETTPAQLEVLTRQLPKPGDLYAGYARASRAEFAFVVEYIDRFAASAIPVGDLDSCMCDNPDNLLSFWGIRSLNAKTLPRYSFQRNRTVAQAAEHCREYVLAAPHSYAEQMQSVAWPEDVSPDTRWKFVKRNSLGVAMERLFLWSMPSFRDLKRLECDLSGTRLVLACNAYRKTSGEWPPTLEALVPRFLDAVPRDPYDGERFRYSRERAIVYAVGVDLRDQGGSGRFPPGSKRAEDVIFPLERRPE